MTVPATGAPMSARVDPPMDGGERAILEGYLDYFRATVLEKTVGLSDAQGAQRLLPSEMTVTGLLRHLADVERYWFREVVHEVPEDRVGYRWFDKADLEAEWHVTATDSLEEARSDFADACRDSRTSLAAHELDEQRTRRGETISVRGVMVHMIEELGRHCGHLDVMVELLDGRTGE